MSIDQTYSDRFSYTPKTKSLLSFLASVFIVLTLSECWVMPLTGPDGNPDASTLIRYLYFPAYIVIAIFVISNWLGFFYVALKTPLLWVLMFIVALSTSWSIAPDVTMRRAIALLFTILAGEVLAARYSWAALTEVVGVAFLIIIFLCFFLCILVPSYGRMTALFPGAWRGAWFEKNGLGDNMSIACIALTAAAVFNPKRRWFWMTVSLLSIILVIFSRSKTSLVGLALGLTGLAFVGLVKRGPIWGVLTTFFTVTTAGVAGIMFYFNAKAAFELLGKDSTLTGRTTLWGPIITQIETRPWLGFGYSAVWNNKSVWGPLAWISKQAKFVAAHSHNSWLEIRLGIGLVGFCVFIVCFFDLWTKVIFSTYFRKSGYFALPFSLIYSAMTISENVILVYDEGLIWMLFVMLYVKLSAPHPSDLRSRPYLRKQECER